MYFDEDATFHKCVVQLIVFDNSEDYFVSVLSTAINKC